MDFLFFNAADKPLFSRNDPESATWTVEERNLQLLFPYDAPKPIERGMRVGFVDETGVFQPFEVRKVKTYEPDHYQEITAEHIVIAELTDEHYAGSELTNVTPQVALSSLLTGTLWSVGTVTATNTSSANLGIGSVYQNLRTIETNWNVYITPRVTFDSTGITGRFLDIAPAGGVWRGVRLSINKNADEMGVTVDDTETLTALFGYGRSSDNVPLNFSDVTWTATADHPAKPAGQTYIEDPAATAAYGRNGRARFGYYQNSDITDANVLLQKTWEALKATNKPRVSIDCMVRDLYRLGYADQPIRLHDTAIVDVEPTGMSVRLEIIRLTVDLLDPTATRPTIGAYIPNIIYINRQTANRASGGRGGGASGRRGQTGSEQERTEFEVAIQQIGSTLALKAWQNDMTKVEGILRAAGIDIDPITGVAIYSTDYTTNLGSILDVQSNRIGMVVTDGSNPEIKSASIVTAINNAGSSVHIDADKIYLNGEAIANSISAANAKITNLENGTTTASRIFAEYLYATQNFRVGDTFAYWSSVSMPNVLDGAYNKVLGTQDMNLAHYHDITATEGTGSDAGKILITLGATRATEGTTNFNIAATQFYQDGVAAAAAGVTVGSPSWTNGTTSAHFTVSASNGQSTTQYVYLLRGSWSNGSCTVNLRSGSAQGTVRASNTVTIPDPGSSDWSISPKIATQTVTVTIGGKTFSHTFS